MLIFTNPSHVRHAGRQELFRGRLVPCHEVPARIDHVLTELGRRPVGEIHAAAPIPDSALERVHARRYLEFLRGAWAEWIAQNPANAGSDALPSVWPVRGFRTDIEPSNFAARLGLYSFDAGTPLTAGTWIAAQEGAACAAAAARALRAPAPPRATMALVRPPGHHAGHDFFGGYCFINNAAVAAQTLLDDGARRVAVIDVDYHHGNARRACSTNARTFSPFPSTATRGPSTRSTWATRTNAAPVPGRDSISICRCRPAPTTPAGAPR